MQSVQYFPCADVHVCVPASSQAYGYVDSLHPKFRLFHLHTLSILVADLERKVSPSHNVLVAWFPTLVGLDNI